MFLNIGRSRTLNPERDPVFLHNKRIGKVEKMKVSLICLFLANMTISLQTTFYGRENANTRILSI